MDPYALIASYPNPGQAFAQSFEHGQQTGQQNMARAAAAALVRDPSNQKALEALASVDPGAAQQFQQQRMEQAKAGLAEHQDNIIKGAEIIRQFQPKDQASYTAALNAAHMAGIDVSQAPQQFDPQYVAGIVHLADAFHPQQGQSPHFVPFQQGGGVLQVGPDGSTKMLVQPNDGSHPAGAPVGADGPPEAAVARLKANPHEAAQFDEIFGPGASQKALGGAGPSQAPQTFP